MQCTLKVPGFGTKHVRLRILVTNATLNYTYLEITWTETCWISRISDVPKHRERERETEDIIISQWISLVLNKPCG